MTKVFKEPKSYIDRVLKRSISRMTSSNWVDEEPTPPGPTPVELTPFDTTHVVTAVKFDARTDEGKATYTPMDEFLASLTYDERGQAYIVTHSGTTDTMVGAGRIDSTYVLLVGVGSDPVFVYSTEDNEDLGLIAGWQNLDENNEVSLGRWPETPTYVLPGDWNGTLIGAVQGQPQPTELTHFDVGQTIQGFQLDPAATPTGGYGAFEEAMTQQYPEGADLGIVVDTSGTEAVFVASGASEMGGYAIVSSPINNNHTQVVYIPSEQLAQAFRISGFDGAGWYEVTGFGQGSASAVKVTQFTTYQITDTYPNGIEIGTIDPLFEALNGYVLGAVETEPQPTGLTPFSVGEDTLSRFSIKIDPSMSIQEVNGILSNIAPETNLFSIDTSSMGGPSNTHIMGVTNFSDKINVKCIAFNGADFIYLCEDVDEYDVDGSGATIHYHAGWQYDNDFAPINGSTGVMDLNNLLGGHEFPIAYVNSEVNGVLFGKNTGGGVI